MMFKYASYDTALYGEYFDGVTFNVRFIPPFPTNA
jgi:hypothetical protein